MKNEKGITLIALIITIIVMLILVGVTINVALNGGIFDKAKNAKDLTQKEIEREELVTAAVGLYDVDTGITQSQLTTELSKLNNKYTVDNEKTVVNSKYVVSGTSGTIWQIDLKTAEVTEYVENQSDELGELFVLYYKNMMAGNSNDEVIQRSQKLGATEQDILKTLNSMKNFTDEIENCGYAYANYNNTDYLYHIDYSTGNVTYIPKSNTEKYAMLANLFLIRDELKQKLNGMTRAQVNEIFDNQETAETFVRNNSNAIITSVDGNDINGVHTFSMQFDDQDIFKDIIIYDP